MDNAQSAASDDSTRLLEHSHSRQRQLTRKNKRLTAHYRTALRVVDNVSHEFRTPLTVIMEYTAMLQQQLAGTLDDRQRRMLDICADRAEDLSNMINDMLDVSNFNAGILGISRSTCQIGEIIEHVRPNLVRKAAIKGGVIEVELQPGLPPIYCDPEKIGRVIANLASTAIKLSGQAAKVRIAVSVDPIMPQIVVSVTDNGPGVDERRLGELFKRFRPRAAPRRRRSRSFDLGLSMAKEIVQQNFGEIRVQSVVGKGNTFSFTVPIYDPLEITRRFLRRSTATSRELSLVEAVVQSGEAGDEPGGGDDLHAFLNCVLRRNDLMFRTGPQRWLLLLMASATEVELVQHRAQKMREATNQNRPFGALPEIRLARLGTWPIKNHAGQILDALDTALTTTTPDDRSHQTIGHAAAAH